MRAKWFVAAAAILTILSACHDRERTLTGAYGDGVISGEVFVPGGASPAGIEVSVSGTGMARTVGDDGRFAFAGVPKGATLRLLRAADGIDASVGLSRSFGTVSIEVNGRSATAGRRRPSVPLLQFEGLIRSVSANSLTVYTSHKEKITIMLTPQTVIRKGGQILTAADLKVDDRVHVKASVKDDVKTAVEVIVQ